MMPKLISAKQFITINIGCLMTAAGIYFFKAPNGFATGGVSGISIILSKISEALSIPIPQSVYMTVINLALLVAGVLLLGKQCGLMTIYCSTVMSLENMMFEFLLPIEFITGGNPTLTGTPLLELVYAVMLTGIGAALLFKCNASSGGTDIIALILKKYTHMNVGTALLFSDFIIAASTFFVYSHDLSVGLYAMLGLFAKVFIVDDILDSMNLCKAFTIITTEADRINEFIVKEMHHGATMYYAKGVYTDDPKQVIITVCKRSEALKLRMMVKKVDPHAFIIITKTSEISGKGFRDSQEAVEIEQKKPKEACKN